jgi:beta-N-acetylhexosaminidase
VGLHTKRLVNIEKLSDVIESEQYQTHATTVAERALTLVKNEANLLPVPASELCMVILPERAGSSVGRRLLEEASSRQIAVTVVDPTMSAADMQTATDALGECKAIAVSAIVSTGAYQGRAGLRGAYPEFLDSLVRGDKPVALIALGTPYTLRQYPEVRAAVATFSHVPASEAAVVRALVGEIPFRGKTPVTIPGMLQAGQQIEIGRGSIATAP